MRFSTEHAHAILQGSKREHRVPMRRTCRLVSTARGQVRTADLNGEFTGLYRELPYRVGDEHRIQRPRHVDEMTPLQRVRFEEGNGERGHVGIGRFAITSVHAEFLGDLTYESARAEGHRSRADFARSWMGFPADDLSDDEDVLEVFEHAHADTPVWVLGLIVVGRDTVRPLGIKVFDHTEDGLRVPEPERVDKNAEEQITKVARMDAKQRLAHEQAIRDRYRGSLVIEERFRAAEVHAKRTGAIQDRTIRREIWLLRRDLTRASSAQLEARLVKVEERMNLREAA